MCLLSLSYKPTKKLFKTNGEPEKRKFFLKTNIFKNITDIGFQQKAMD